MEGRLAQVTEMCSRSRCREKTEFSRRHDGVCLALLVGKRVAGDELLNSRLAKTESDQQRNENNGSMKMVHEGTI